MGDVVPVDFRLAGALPILRSEDMILANDWRGIWAEGEGLMFGHPELPGLVARAAPDGRWEIWASLSGEPPERVEQGLAVPTPEGWRPLERAAWIACRVMKGTKWGLGAQGRDPDPLYKMLGPGPDPDPDLDPDDEGPKGA